MAFNKTILAAGSLIIFLITSLPIQAENNQTLALGGGIGAYNFNDEDLNAMENLLYSSEFIEWYVFDEIGIGVRSHKFYKSGSGNGDEELLMADVNLAVTWVVFGSSSALRMAVYAGYGPGGVTYSNEAAQIDISTTGNTNSYGLFFDWGGERWGVRLGYHQVFASFEYEDGPVSGTIDGSGSSYDVAVRLSF